MIKKKVTIGPAQHNIRSMRTLDRVQTKPLLGGLGEVWLYTLRPVLSRSLPTLPDTHNQRLFVAAWCLVCLILTAAYTANLIAFLTIPLYQKQLETVEQLAESDFRVSMLDYGEFVPQALRSSQDPFYRALAAKLDLFADEADSVYPVLKGTHAYIQAYYYARILFSEVYEARNIYLLREQLYPNHLCWYFQKNTAWKFKFDIELQNLLQTGLVAHWVKLQDLRPTGRPEANWKTGGQLEDRRPTGRPEANWKT